MTRDRSNWMLNPRVFQWIQAHFPHLEVDLFATRLIYQLPQFYSWRPDPLVEATDTFLQDWRQVKGYANPPWNLVESVIEGGSSGGRTNTNSPSLALTTMVSHVTELAGGATIEDRPSASSNGGRGPTPPNPTSSCVAYVRQHYSGKKRSTEATDLLLSSWRSKTSQSYDSLCKKWIGWCSERHYDLVSGPIEDVVNFLAHLHETGYQYRSLNAYRSAIASMHAPIEGYLLGNTYW